jgi:hypothetical protein
LHVRAQEHYHGISSGLGDTLLRLLLMNV